jgi:hypothetical protein
MKIEGFTRDELLQNVKVFSFTSTPAHAPGASVFLDEEYSLLGGGFEVNYTPGKGNLAIGSFPVDSLTWGANSKDMDIPDSCSIKVSGIGIKTQLTKQDSNGVDKPTGHC